MTIGADDAGLARPGVARRSFLKWSGAGAVALTLPAIGAQSAFAQAAAAGAVDLGMGDVGALNYAYALEQLEAAFYTQAVQTPYAGMSSAERQILTDIRDHEVAHRELFQAALGANAIPDLSVNFSAINFRDRTSVLTTARTFEDLGVSAYNGAGQYLMMAEYLLLAGKIVSVEARHAAVIRDLLNPLSADFAGDDVVDSFGLDVARDPSEVLALAAPFIATPVTARSLP